MWMGWGCRLSPACGSACPVPTRTPQQVPPDTPVVVALLGTLGTGFGAASLDCQTGQFCNYANCLICTEIH